MAVTFSDNIQVNFIFLGTMPLLMKDEEGDLVSLDISDPSNPRVADNLAIGSSVRDLYVSGRYAYILESINGQFDRRRSI